MLNEKCPRIDLETSDVKLFPHQQAVVSRMNEMEITKLREVYERGGFDADFGEPCVGLLADPPGSGKSYCVLGTILHEKEFTRSTWTNLLIVPYSLYEQWKDYVRKFSSKLTLCELNDYNSIMKLTLPQNGGSLDAFDVVITTTLFYPTIDDTMRAIGRTFHRIIIDEVDSVSFFMSDIIPCENLWLISASVDLTRTKIFKNIVCDESRTIKCEPVFIRNSINLPPVNEKTCVCDNPYVDMIRMCVDNHVVPDEWETKWYKKCFAGDLLSFNFPNVRKTNVVYKSGESIEENHRRFLQFVQFDLLRRFELTLETEKQVQSKLNGETAGGANKQLELQRRRELLLGAHRQVTPQPPKPSGRCSRPSSVRKTHHTLASATSVVRDDDVVDSSDPGPTSADAFNNMLFDPDSSIMNAPFKRRINYGTLLKRVASDNEELVKLRGKISNLSSIACANGRCCLCFADQGTMCFGCEPKEARTPVFVCRSCVEEWVATSDICPMCLAAIDSGDDDGKMAHYMSVDPCLQKSMFFELVKAKPLPEGAVDKDDCLRDILAQETKRPDSKVLICSDFFGSFAKIREVLDELSLKYAEIDGTVDEINKNVSEFQTKGSDKHVMLINVRQYGAGFNFEMATAIVVMHKTNRLEQVLGRAQRFGRTTPLNAYYVYYQSETNLP